MPQALNIQDETYAGEAASFLLLRQVESMDTYEKSCVTVIDEIKKQHTIDRLEITNYIQDSSATPVSQGSVTVDSRVLVPEDYQVYFEFNPRLFEQNWFAVELQDPLLMRPLPPTVQSYMMLHLMKKMNIYNEYAIWNSRTAYNPNTGTESQPAFLTSRTGASNFYYFDGIIKKALADPNTILVPSAVTLTSSNIRGWFQTAINLVPPALLERYGKTGLRFLLSKADKLVYSQALREDTFKNENTTESSIDKWSGYDVTSLAGLPAGTFLLVIANPDPLSGNLFVGINSKDDSQVQLQNLQNNSSLWFVRALQKMDANIGFTDQVVLYTTETN